MRKAPVIGLAVAVALAMGYWFGLYKPALDEQAAVEQQTSELERRQSDLRNEIAQLEEVRSDEVRIRAAVSRLEEFVPTGIALPQAVRQFQIAADAAGVEITSLSFGEPTVVEGAPDTGDPATTLASISVSMIVEGGYFQTVDFFRRVEQDVARAVLTQSVNIAEGEEKFPSLATTWGGELFSVVPVASTVAPDDPSAAPGGAPDADAPEAGEGDPQAPDDADAPDEQAPPEGGTGETTTARGREEGNVS